MHKAFLHWKGRKAAGKEAVRGKIPVRSELRQVADVIFVFRGVRIFQITIPVFSERPEIIIRIQAVAHFQVFGPVGSGGDGLLAAQAVAVGGTPWIRKNIKGNRPAVLAFHMDFPDSRVAFGLRRGVQLIIVNQDLIYNHFMKMVHQYCMLTMEKLNKMLK